MRRLPDPKKQTNPKMLKSAINAFQTSDFPTVKMRKLPGRENQPNPKKQTNTKTKLAVLLAFIAVVLAVYFFTIIDGQVKLLDLKEELKTKVMSQSNAVQIVTRSLENVENWPKKLKVLPFIGSSGVGKTYIANIIKKHFHHSLVNEISQSDLVSDDAKNRLVGCLNIDWINLVIIDNLVTDDLQRLFDFLEILPHDIIILVIPIFSVQYTNEKLEHYINYDDFRQIELKFDQSKYYHEVVLFDEIAPEVANKWLHKKITEIKGRGDHKLMIKNILDNHDVKYCGLKGLHAKIYI